MPYGNDVFEVCPQSIENMAENLATSPAPWLNLATRGLSHNHSWTEVMRMTSQSKSSDARDSLYGVLGLWASGGSLPIPSYAISYQHMMIGMFAWLLIHEHDLNVLLAAKCISFAEYEDPLPSWIPPWRTHNFWQWFINVSSRNQVKPPGLTFPVKNMTYNNGELGPPYGRPWHQSRIAVDHNTGALSLVAIKIHVMQFDLQKRDTDPSDDVWSSRCCLHVQTSKNIAGIVKEGDEIYLLSPSTPGGQDKHEPLVYLFLRKVANRMHTLVLCEPMVYFKRCPVWESLEETRVDRSLAVDELQELWHRPMYKFDEDMHTGGFLGRGLQRTFPGNDDTPFHVLLAVILSSNDVQWSLDISASRNYDIQRLLDNDAARGFDANIKTNEKFVRYGKTVSYLTFKFSKSYWEDVEAFYTMDKNRLDDEGTRFQCNDNPPESGDWDPIYARSCWDLPERFRHKEMMYVECELPNVHKLLLRIDRELCITSIWRSIGIRNPKGSWGELLYARAVYPSMTDPEDLKANDEHQRHHSIHRVGNSIVVGLESRIHIV
ncbi:hypothetical protein CGCTS75_v012184 [Colletotrichum tropicale]|nr:hypothetical protein CGCTS75_v012184 [Colletotrichum tropicale]